ncbi:MAG TPA: sugar-binding protein [Planctomycetaceae bacterium]|nr:sugar-binding protein [Planctomycetaceae bacterium]
MQRFLSVLGVTAILLSFTESGLADPEPPRGIPLKPDPPIAVDGDLGDWASVPNSVEINQPAQVVFGPEAWSGEQDLSGVVQLAWRQEYLFVAVRVTDDIHRHAQQASETRRGDHVQISIDVQPATETDRTEFGAGQFQLVLSPGRLVDSADSLTDDAPKAICLLPADLDVSSVQVAAARTEHGWTLEAAIPWGLLSVTPEQNFPLNVEVALSDADGDDAQQESLLTSGTQPWELKRTRLRPMVLTGSNGVPGATSVPLLDALEIAQGKTATLHFDASPVPAGRQAVLRFWARLDTKVVAGYTQCLRLVFNEQPLSGERLLNKKLRVKARAGQVSSMYAGDRLTVFYAPDFDSPTENPHYGLTGGVVPCLFEVDVTDCIKPGANELVLHNDAVAGVQNILHVGRGTLVYQVPSREMIEKSGPPTGPIPTIAPRRDLHTNYTAEALPDAKILLKFASTEVVVESRFSTPKPGWVQGSNDYFSHDRRIEQRDEGVVVYDTFTNKTTENLGIMHRHQANLGERMQKLWLAGLEKTSGTGESRLPANCTTFGAADTWGLGFIASDDVFRVHCTNYGAEGSIGLADNNLVLPPGASYTAEWILVPVEAPDYYRFINTARRFMGANFLIDGGFAFLRAGELTEAWSDDQVQKFLEYKNPKYVCATIHSNYKGRYSHGTAFQQVDHERFPRAFERWRRLYPDVSCLVYFHCFLDVTDEAEAQFHDARTLRANGSQANYGQEHQRIFLPMTGNSYGAAVSKNVDIILDKLGADGVYWDEHEYSNEQYHYGEPWDHFTGDIDPQSMRIRGLKSSVTLLTEDWRVNLAKSILSRGSLIGNGSPYTRAMVALNFPCFVETGAITNCTLSHLYSPIALGDHLTERSQQDAYGTMLAALDYGCVYHWYNDMTVTPTHKTITSQMFPITPQEIHAGYLIGKERIVTRLSGTYGWGDDSRHELHVYNDQGEEVADFEAPFTEKNGVTWTELRLAEDWSAVIVRR